MLFFSVKIFFKKNLNRELSMCICLGRITIDEAKKIVHPDTNSMAPKDMRLRELAFYYTARQTANILKKLVKDFAENKKLAYQRGKTTNAKIVMVLLDTTQVIQRLFEAATFFLRYITGVIQPALVFKDPIKELTEVVTLPPEEKAQIDITAGPLHFKASVEST